MLTTLIAHIVTIILTRFAQSPAVASGACLRPDAQGWADCPDAQGWADCLHPYSVTIV